MPRTARAHLPFAAWPPKDRELWDRKFERDAFDDESLTSHLAPATVIGLRASYARYLGFLARRDPERLDLAPALRVDPESIKAFVAHLRETCRDTTVASLLQKLRLTLKIICPKHNWSWLKTVAKRIDADALPLHNGTKGITSAELYAVGVSLMKTAEDALLSSRHVSLKNALLYRDGLMIALLALVPLRRRTFTALTINAHLVKAGDCWLLDIPAADTKTKRALEFPLPQDVSLRISAYLARFRTVIPGSHHHAGLWPSARGRPMDDGTIYDTVRSRTTEALGFPINLHRFRLAAGNLWSIADPANVRGVKDLLGQLNFDTTERHYIDAQSRLAGRALAEALQPAGLQPTRRIQA
jgi:hypothetical protein